ncbi:hypothetical protein AB0L24_32245 [Streptomyces achromogenes]
MALQVDVAELVDGSGLSQDAPHLVGVRQEVHQVAWQGVAVAHSQIQAGQGEFPRGGAVDSCGQAEHEPAPQPDAATEDGVANQFIGEIHFPQVPVQDAEEDPQEEPGQKSEEGAGAHEGPEGLVVLAEQLPGTRHCGEVCR